MSSQPTVAIDLDGTIIDYSEGWIDENHYGPLLPRAAEAINTLVAIGWKVIIFTCRTNKKGVADFLNGEGVHFSEVYDGADGRSKPVAHAYIDDRGIQFNGDWMKTIQDLATFAPWYVRETKDEDSESGDDQR